MGNLIKKLQDFFASREMEIVIVGLENSGKSTLTSKLTGDDNILKGPTLGLDLRTAKKNNVTMKLWDLGGQGRIMSSIQKRMVQIRYRLQCHYLRR